MNDQHDEFFVYLLKYLSQPKFKIGKAKDIHKRIPLIGGREAFDLKNSLCIRLNRECDAYRLEKLLHSLFSEWNLPVDTARRYEGDTEHFDVMCFDRVIEFIRDNQDLVNKARAEPLPKETSQPKPNVVPIEERRARRESLRIERQKEARRRLEDGVAGTEDGISRLVALNLDVLERRAGEWATPNGSKYPTQKVIIETSEPQKLETARAIAAEVQALTFDREARPNCFSRVFSSVTSSWEPERGYGWLEIDLTNETYCRDENWDRADVLYKQMVERFFACVPLSTTPHCNSRAASVWDSIAKAWYGE